MNTEKVKESIKQCTEELSEENLRTAYQFIEYLADQEREEATQELLEIPDLLEDIELAKQDIAQGDLIDWRDVRTDV